MPDYQTMNPSHWKAATPDLEALAAALGDPWRTVRDGVGGWRVKLAHAGAALELRAQLDRTAGLVVRCVIATTETMNPRQLSTDSVPVADVDAVRRIISEAAELRDQYRAEWSDACALFADELRQLLEKHGASIDFTADGCSDWHGITGERIGFTIGRGFHAVDHSTSFSAGDLDDDG